MQPGVVAARLLAKALTGDAKLATAAQQIVLDDWRLGNFVSTGAGPVWAAPTSNYSLVGTTSGDYIAKTSYSPVQPWDLGFQDLGINTPVTLPDSTTDTPFVSSAVVDATTDLVCFYANRFRTGLKTGIYVMFCRDDGAGNLWWSQPIAVSPTFALNNFNQMSQLFVTFPRIQIINGEYWILALEASKEVNVITYHLCYFRSKDGENWTDRQYLAGVSNDPAETSVGINQHNSGTPFIMTDLKHAYLSVSGNTTYIVGKNGNFSCQSTSLVGISNPAMQIDLTPDIVKYTLSQPAAPTATQGNFTLMNRAKTYNQHPLLVAGARIVQKAGLETAVGQELLTVSYQLLDEIRQPTRVDPTTNEFHLTTIDYSGWLRDQVFDTPYEVWSPHQSQYQQFCDLTALSVVNGRFFVGYDNLGTDLTVAAATLESTTRESMGFFRSIRSVDGCAELQFKFTQNINIANTAAIVFQTAYQREDRAFWEIAYWVVLGKWTIAMSVPATTGMMIHLDTFPMPGSPQTAQTLSPDTLYWLKVLYWHNHVVAWTSPDHITWTKVIDYTSPVTPGSNSVIPSNQTYWGLLGHSVSTDSGAIGNPNHAEGGLVSMASGSTPQYWAFKFTTGANVGTFTEIAGLFTQTNTPSDLTLGIAVDNGLGTAPADLTNVQNIVYSSPMRALNFSTRDGPIWRGLYVPSDKRAQPNTVYWIFWTFATALSFGQTWEWYTDTGGTHGTTMTSADGVTWSAVAGKSAAVCVFIAYDSGLMKFNQANWSSGEDMQTVESLSKLIASRGGVLDADVDSFVASADLIAGWQPSSFGKLGDFVMDADVNGTGPQVYFRATTNGTPSTGYQLNVGNTMTLLRNGVTLYTIASAQVVPTAYSFHLRVACWNKMIYVWINRTLAMVFFDANATVPGYFGVGTSGTAVFSNLRIPDMTPIRPYTILKANESALQSLTSLVSKTRYRFFINYLGHLRIGSFLRRTSQATVSATMEEAERVITNRYAVSQMQPRGNYTSMRWSAQQLATTGRRIFKQSDYTDAFTNESAYIASDLELQRALELAQQGTLKFPVAMIPSEREDRITVVNPLDGTSTDFILNDITMEFDMQSQQPKASQKSGTRLFIV